MYSKCFFALLLVFSVTTFSNSQRNKKFFRDDYTYIEAAESFYKFHTIPRSWLNAKHTCKSEGGYLFFPENDAEAKIFLEYWKATQPMITWIYVGISSLLAKGVFETVDGRPIRDVYHKWGVIQPSNSNDNEDCVGWRREENYHDNTCFKKYIFVCKKTLASLEWHEKCDMPNMGYKFNEQLGRCYKFHSQPMNWPDAHARCSAELSYLAIINSNTEADYLIKLTETALQSNVRSNVMTGLVLLGFHDRLDEGWTTVRGTPLEDSGYTTWVDGPHDGTRVVNEKCGSMLYNGTLNTVSCDKRSIFICEHEISNITTSFNDRMYVRNASF